MKRLTLVIVSVALVVAMLAVGCAEPTTTPEYPTTVLFAISTKPESGDFPCQSRIATLGGEALKEQFGVTVTIAMPGGSVASTQWLLERQGWFANSNTSALTQALGGFGTWEGNPQPNTVRGLHQRDFQENTVAVRTDSGITKMSDLMGKKVFYGHPGTTCNANMKMAMEVLGYDPYIEEYVGSLADGVAAMKDRRIDAYVKTTRGEVADPTQIDIMVTQELELITFTEEEVKKIQEVYPFLAYRIFGPDAFTKVAPMNILGERWMNFDGGPTICDMDVPEEWAYAWVTHIINNWDVLVPLMEVLGTFDPLDYPALAADFLFAGRVDYYLHPGAIRAYRDFGVDVPDLLIPPEMK